MENKQTGRSMVEMLGVLAIIAVLSVGIYMLYSIAMGKLRANQTIDTVQRLIQDIR